MIYRRAIAKLRAQDWFAIGVEFAIVVAGVFVGSWVNDWSQARSERRASKTLVLRLRPELERLAAIDRAERDYYTITQRFAETALAGWAKDPKVTDADFVIAAYQASQTAGVSIEGSSLSVALGADSVHKIDDPSLRAAVISLLTFNFAALRAEPLQDDYRKHVREVLPYPVQKRVRDVCGDRYTQDYLILPRQCAISLAPGEAAEAAARLRSNPYLAGELAYHVAQTKAWLSNLDRLDARLHPLLALIDRESRGAWS